MIKTLAISEMRYQIGWSKFVFVAEKERCSQIRLGKFNEITA
jgi:hypothetical protein